MRDRLIELIKRDNCRNPFNCSSQCKYVESDDCHSERLADLILADGWIRPPCKVGDIVYVITSDSPTGIEETRVSQIKIKVKENGKISYRISAPCVYDDWGEAHWTFCEFDFGKTVFLSREEAEAKLKEG